jgi:hypothetical protein
VYWDGMETVQRVEKWAEGSEGAWWWCGGVVSSPRLEKLRRQGEQGELVDDRPRILGLLARVTSIQGGCRWGTQAGC